jgi:hypothetical protein
MGLLEKRWGTDKAISGVEAVGNIINKVHTNDEKRAQAEIIKQKQPCKLH